MLSNHRQRGSGMRRLGIAAAFGALAVTATSCAGAGPSASVSTVTETVTTTVTAQPAAPVARYVIKRVIDGDTVRLDDGRKIQLLGVDAVETEHPCGDEARAFLQTYSGATVAVVTDPVQEAVDRYGRTLAYLVADGVDLSVGIAMAGWGDYYDTGMAVSKAADIRSAVRKAKDAATGIWAPNACQEPTATSIPAPPVQPPAVDAPADGDSGSTSDDESSGDGDNTGDSGHPCLPGERDGDGDGYCGET